MVAPMFGIQGVVLLQNVKGIFLTKIMWMLIRFGPHFFKCERRVRNGGFE
jgi:hypothetical protein